MSHDRRTCLIKAGAAAAGSVAAEYYTGGGFMPSDVGQKAAVAGVSSFFGTKVAEAMGQSHNFTRAAVCGALQTAMNSALSGDSDNNLKEFLVNTGIHYATDMAVLTIGAQHHRSVVAREMPRDDYGCY